MQKTIILLISLLILGIGTAFGLAIIIDSDSSRLNRAKSEVKDQLEVAIGLIHTEWELISMHGTDITAADLTLSFDTHNQLSGFDGCNQFSGEYQIIGDKMWLSYGLQHTLASCLITTEVYLDGVLQSESRDTSVMDRADRYVRVLMSRNRIYLDGEHLIIEIVDKDLIFQKATSP